MRPPAPPRPHRARHAWSRLLTTTALTLAPALTLTGVTTLTARPAAAVSVDPISFDFAAAAQVREDQCRLSYVSRKGGPALKALARKGLNGTEADLHDAAAKPEYDVTTPLDTAYNQDTDSALAKGQEISARTKVWDDPLGSLTPPDGYGYSVYQQAPDFFTQIGLGPWLGEQIWLDGYDLQHADPTPLAGKESADKATTLANSLFAVEPPVQDPSWNDFIAERDAWHMASLHPLKADDVRLFLQYGGFPRTAPAPDSLEFRIDVEALKARFASCAFADPIDPHHALDAEVQTAATEWQAELDSQKTQRDTIMSAEAQANADLVVASQAMGEALGESWLADLLTKWQAFWLKADPGRADYPEAADFTQVKNEIADAQSRAAGRAYVAARASVSAKASADRVATAQTQAYAVADAAGQPRGRGLLAAQQSAQVAKASAAAAQAAAKATETAANATRASAADSKTLMALADTQAHATQAEFHRAAAEEAAAQAKAAADGAAAQAALAAQNATKAKTAQAKAEAAEATAKSAADEAHDKRLAAESERDKAAAARAEADSQRAQAHEAEERAQSEREAAAEADSAAQTAGQTAAAKKDEALAAESRATQARDDAVQAERNHDALSARASAYEAQAAAAEGTDAAEAARTAATQARTDANNAASAAANARTAANDATEAATAAREASTRADAAAARSRAAADAAQADAATTNAAVTKAHAAAADAIAASETAAHSADTAKKDAATAKAKAVEAQQNAAASRAEANAAAADAARTAGYAYATAQAATAARDSATQVIQPANDAIELGSPYLETDSSAGLAVLTGEASKTAAQQQAAVAKAKADQAAKAATEAAAIAAKADVDAKAAAQASAAAADSAAKAAQSLAQAQSSAADAAEAAAAATKAEAQTVDYDAQATADAAVAESAADTATGHATAARSAADEAEQDAASAHDAADTADHEAANASSAADQADRDASTAETAAAKAREAAEEAEAAATRAEQQKDTEQQESALSESGPTGVAGIKAVPIEDTLVDEITSDGDCEGTHTGADVGCEVTLHHHVTGTLIYVLLTCPLPDTTFTDCIGSLTADYLDTAPIDLTYTNQTHIDGWKLTADILKAVATGMVRDFIDCAHGKASGCAWAIGSLLAPEAIGLGAKYAIAVRSALRSGSGLAEALFNLRHAGLSAEAVSGIERAGQEALAAGNCFPAGTMVAVEGGAKKAIEDVKVGDRVWSANPMTGEQQLRRVTRLFRHSVDSLIRINTESGTLEATAGHRFWVQAHGWVAASELRPDDAFEGMGGRSVRVVSLARDRRPAEVYNFEVETDHTYYVFSGDTPVLVHNDCTELVKAGDHVVLGVWPYSDAVAEELGGWTFNGKSFGDPFPNGDGRPIWMVGVQDAIDNAAVKLSVTLDGVADAGTADEALAALLDRGVPLVGSDWRLGAAGGNGTAWEVATLRLKIILGKRTWESVDWYMNGKQVFPTKPDWAFE